MNELEQISIHIEIEETIGYDCLKGAAPEDVPALYQFARIIWNYIKMTKIKRNERS